MGFTIINPYWFASGGAANLAYVTSGIGGGTTTIAAHESGDIIVAVGYDDGARTVTSIADWTHIDALAGFGNYRVSIFSRVSDGTVADITMAVDRIGYIILRPTGGTPAVGAYAGAGGSSLSVALPSLTLDNTDGSSWVLGVICHGGAGAGGFTTSDLTERFDDNWTGSRNAWLGDTNGGVASWAGGTATCGTSSQYVCASIEVKVT